MFTRFCYTVVHICDFPHKIEKNEMLTFSIDYIYNLSNSNFRVSCHFVRRQWCTVHV